MGIGGMMRAALAAAALFTAQQACAQTGLVTGPEPLISGGSELKPAGDPSRWITDADYPAAAKVARESGTVGFVLQVDPDGMVSDCTVVQSSGSKALDSTTCKLLERRARFVPARDSNNDPTGATWRNSLSWILPAPPPEARKD